MVEYLTDGDLLTSEAASLINCLADCFHIAGTVITQRTSSAVYSTPLCPCIRSKAFSFRYFKALENTSRARKLFPFRALRRLYRFKVSYKKQNQNEGRLSGWNAGLVNHIVFLPYFAPLSLSFYIFKFCDTVRSTFVLATFFLATFRNALWDLKISFQTLGRAPKKKW